MIGGERDLLGVVQEIWIRPYELVVYAQPRIRTVQISLRFWDTNRSPNLDQMTRPRDNQQKK